jgi:hypothetical protein
MEKHCKQKKDKLLQKLHTAGDSSYCGANDNNECNLSVSTSTSLEDYFDLESIKADMLETMNNGVSALNSVGVGSTS